MKILDYERELLRSGDERPFSNGFEWDHWSNSWCERCLRVSDCPLLDVALINQRRPFAWLEINARGLSDRYHCAGFQLADD